MPEALIWGASGGIGRALVTLLKSEGWRIFAAARHDNRIPQEADSAYQFDAQQPDSFERAALLVAQESEAINWMIYAAGGLQAQAVTDLTAASWQAVMDANLNGAFHAFRAAYPLLAQEAHVMFIGAYVDKLMLPRFSAYAAAKAGLEPLVSILQKEHRKLSFTLVRPGAVATPFWEQVPFRMPANALTPQDVAQAMMQRYASGEKGLLDL
jgi:NAD(P)-dependent dehydrogenase (short-subunit alcohol dehydrogenase family)